MHTHLEHRDRLVEHSFVVPSGASKGLDAPEPAPVRLTNMTTMPAKRLFTYQRVHRQKVPSSPPTPSSVFDTSYRYTKP